MAQDITKDVIGVKEFEVQKVNLSGEPAEFFGSITEDNHIVNKAYVDSNDFWKRVAGILSPKVDGDHIQTTGLLILGMGASAAPSITTNSAGWEFDGLFNLLSNDLIGVNHIKRANTDIDVSTGIVMISDKTSIDWTARNLKADDGIDAILDWSTVGLADFQDSNIITDGKVLLNSPTGEVEATGANLVLHMPSGSIIQGGAANAGSQCLQFMTDNNPHYGAWLMSNAYWDLDANTYRQPRANSTGVPSYIMGVDSVSAEGRGFKWKFNVGGGGSADRAIVPDTLMLLDFDSMDIFVNTKITGTAEITSTLDMGGEINLNGQSICTGEAQTEMIIRPIDSAEFGGFAFDGWGFASEGGTNRQAYGYFDGSGNDTIYSIRTSADSGSNWISPLSATQDGDVFGEKFKITKIGGYAVLLTNKTGANSVAGQLVQTDTTTNDAVNLSGVNSDDTIGIILDSGVSDGTDMWVIGSGIANVMMDAAGSVRGDRIISAPVGGFATPWNVGGAVATHFQEIGHCIESRVGAGLARCVLHFN